MPIGRAAADGDIPALELLAGTASRVALDGALMWAARFGRVNTIAALAKRGADPNARLGVNGWSLLEHAIHKDQPY